MRTKNTLPNVPNYMARRLYKQADLQPYKKEYIPGMHSLERKISCSEEQVKKARLLLKFGKSIKEISKVLDIPEFELKRYI